MANRTCRLSNAYIAGISLRDYLRDGDDLLTALGELDGPFDTLEDSYPDWHPAPYSFHGRACHRIQLIASHSPDRFLARSW